MTFFTERWIINVAVVFLVLVLALLFKVIIEPVIGLVVSTNHHFLFVRTHTSSNVLSPSGTSNYSLNPLNTLKEEPSILLYHEDRTMVVYEKYIFRSLNE